VSVVASVIALRQNHKMIIGKKYRKFAVIWIMAVDSYIDFISGSIRTVTTKWTFGELAWLYRI
jgi:hypothetical protein